MLQGIGSYTKDDGSIAPYHRWCSEENEEKAVELVKKQLKYDANTSVTLPQLTPAENYTVSGWKHGDQEYSGTLDLSTLSPEEFAALANDKENPLTITLTAVVTGIVPENTDGSGNGGDSGNTDSGDTGSGRFPAATTAERKAPPRLPRKLPRHRPPPSLRSRR